MKVKQLGTSVRQLQLTPVRAQVGPPDKLGRQQILAMTGSTPHLCNEIGAVLSELGWIRRDW